tara:strand:- start:553 stop:2295 length:1743 start_codon:yes stop_codon:yes gene_type:complete
MNNSSVVVNELRNSSYTNADVLKFHLNDNLQLLNPKETFFKFNLTVGSSTTPAVGGDGETDAEHWAAWFMSDDVASEALVKSIRIVSRKDGTVLEEITDYNLLAKKVGSYTDNSSTEEMKKLYYGADTNDVRADNTLQKRADDPANNTPQTNKTIECFLRLNLSGIFGSKAQLFPCFACPLELQVELEHDSYKVLRGQSGENLQGELTSVYDDDRKYYSKSVGYSKDMAFNGDAFTGVVAAVTGLKINNTAVSGVDVGTATVYKSCTTGAVASTAGVAAAQSTLNEFPFYAGQEIYYNFVGTTSGDLQVADRTAVIKKISVSGTSLVCEFEANVDLSAVDGGPTGAGSLGANNIIVWVKDPGSKPVINLTDVKLICGIVKPDAQMISKYESAMGGAGMGMLCQSWYDYPVNSPANALVISNLVNCKLDRVKAILSFWENVSDGSNMYEDALRTPNNDAVKPRQYVYKLDGLQTPSRAINLQNFQRVRTSAGWWSAQALRETTQALKECGFQVRDLSNCDTDMLIGRALTRFPNTYSLADLQGELRLDLQFTTNTKNLLHHNFVCYTKTLLISPDGVKVME